MDSQETFQRKINRPLPEVRKEIEEVAELPMAAPERAKTPLETETAPREPEMETDEAALERPLAEAGRTTEERFAEAPAKAPGSRPTTGHPRMESGTVKVPEEDAPFVATR